MSPSAITGTPYLSKGPKKIWALPQSDHVIVDTTHLQPGAVSFVSPTYAVTQAYEEAAPVVVADYYDPDLLRKHLDGPGRDWCDSRRFR